MLAVFLRLSFFLLCLSSFRQTFGWWSFCFQFNFVEENQKQKKKQKSPEIMKCTVNKNNIDFSGWRFVNHKTNSPLTLINRLKWKMDCTFSGYCCCCYCWMLDEIIGKQKPFEMWRSIPIWTTRSLKRSFMLLIYCVCVCRFALRSGLFGSTHIFMKNSVICNRRTLNTCKLS